MEKDRLMFGRFQGQLLLAPAGFFQMDEEEILAMTNGCGPAGWAWSIPDTAWGHDLRPICNVHDLMYKMCAGIVDELVADAVFAFNMVISVLTSNGGTLVKSLRLARAFKYVMAVALTTCSDCYWEENRDVASYSRFIESMWVKK